MATLQKFKLLATQCAVVAGSPTRNPTASPVIHLCRRKTLRMFLNRPTAAASLARRILPTSKIAEMTTRRRRERRRLGSAVSSRTCSCRLRRCRRITGEAGRWEMVRSEDCCLRWAAVSVAWPGLGVAAVGC
ncbi:hypothetical protein ACLB2K_037481 [Fragaria x ananassa]